MNNFIDKNIKNKKFYLEFANLTASVLFTVLFIAFISTIMVAITAPTLVDALTVIASKMIKIHNYDGEILYFELSTIITIILDKFGEKVT